MLVVFYRAKKTTIFSLELNSLEIDVKVALPQTLMLFLKSLYICIYFVSVLEIRLIDKIFLFGKRHNRLH